MVQFNEFLKQLRKKSVFKFGLYTTNELLSKYKNNYENKKLEGKPESEIINEFGTPEEIVGSIKNNNLLRLAKALITVIIIISYFYIYININNIVIPTKQSFMLRNFLLIMVSEFYISIMLYKKAGKYKDIIINNKWISSFKQLVLPIIFIFNISIWIGVFYYFYFLYSGSMAVYAGRNVRNVLNINIFIYLIILVLVLFSYYILNDKKRMILVNYTVLSIMTLKSITYFQHEAKYLKEKLLGIYILFIIGTIIYGRVYFTKK